MEDRLNNTLEGKRIVVTGSTSGIGLAMAKLFAQQGATVVVHGGHSQARVDAAVTQVGGGTQGVLANLATVDGTKSLLANVLRDGPVDVWINNAGADVLTGELSTLDFVDKLQKVWEVDVRGTMLLSRGIGKVMRERGSGVIINIGWDQADVGMAGDSGEMFAASKGAVMAFTKSLAKSLAPTVRVNAIAPGWIRTSWGDDASDYWNTRAKSESLAGRWGMADDVAQLALFLASPAASFVNCQVIALNGGFAGHYDPKGEEPARDG